MLFHDRPLSDVEFVAFDLETTGLFPVVNRIVEFGAVRFRLDGRELGSWEQLVDPECLIPPGVTEIHGITDAMVRGQPPLAQALPGFLGFIGTPDTILLAHNATFDLGFLNFGAVKTGLAFPSNPVIDTLDLARTCVRGAPSCRLEDLAVYLGLAESEDQRALSDSRLAMSLFTHLAGRLERLRTVQDLFRLSPPLTADKSRTHIIEPPVGFEDLAVASPRNPVLFKTPYRGPGKMAGWQVEVAPADQDDTVVWRSNLLTVTERVEVGVGDGSFVGPLANQSRLDPGRVYCFHVRQSSDTGQMSEFSPWHQPVRTADESAKPERQG